MKDKRNEPVIKVTNSAFSKARKKFSCDAFIELNQQATNEFYSLDDIQTWCGFRVLGVDGTKYHLPDNEAIVEKFGGQTNQHTEVPMALGSCLYDVFQGLVIDARLAPYKSSERELAFEHLARAQADEDLIVYDRGYPAFWLLIAHVALGLQYCMRVKSSFNQLTKQFVASGKKQAIVTLTPDKDMVATCRQKQLPIQPIQVRLLRIKTSKGVYILITSLLDRKAYPLNAFKELYHLRWQAEEGYKRQKSWLEIENFTGKTPLAIEQDFHAKILTQTLAAITIYAAQVYRKSSVDRRQHTYKTNFAQTLSAMRDTLIRVLFGQLDCLAIARFFRTIASSLSIVRPGRSFERKRNTSSRRRFNTPYKRVL